MPGLTSGDWKRSYGANCDTGSGRKPPVNGTASQPTATAPVVDSTGRRVGMDQEGEEVAPDFAVAFPEALAVPIGGAEGHDGVEVAVEAPAVLLAGAGRQGVAPPRLQDGPQQKRLHARREDGVAGVDGKLAVPELVSEAHLPEIGVALLGAEQVRHPDRGTMAAHHLGHHAGAPAFAHDVDHHLGVLEDPVPAGPPIDPHACLVRAHDPRPAQPGQDDRCRVVEGGLGAAEQGIERAFADGQAEQVFEQAAQALIADGVGEAQVKRHGHYARAKGRAELCWNLGDGSLRKAAYRGGCPSLPEPLRRERYAYGTVYQRCPPSSAR